MFSGAFKRVVPWFSMSEWKTVYQLVYSDNVEDQQCGIEHLVGWKARCPSLPAAVECTLGIFQVLLQDPEHLSEDSVSVLREQQLRLMYSTAVMRFLNLILEVKTDDDFGGTMYSKAEKQSIPEWIVNLRHDAAHGTSLPDLSLLRAAAVFICKWLHEHYWEREAELISDWTVSQEDLIALSADEDELRKIMEAWEALSLYELTGFDNMRQIHDNELKSTISSIHGLLLDRGHIGVQNIKKLSHAKVSTALSLVLRRLVRFFRGRSSTMDKASILANMIVSGDFFLPSEGLMKIMYPNDFDSLDTLQQLPSALAACCTDFLLTLWDLGAIPALVKRLTALVSNDEESNLRKNVAALWTQKILLSCLKVREARKVRSAVLDRLDCKAISLYYKETFPEANRKAIMTAVAFAAVENQRTDLKLGYTWKILQIPDVLTSLDFIKQAISPLPSKFSCLFLPCLLELACPPIPVESRKLLIDFVNSFNGSDVNSTAVITGLETYSVGDLSSDMNVDTDVSSQDKLANESENESLWALSQGHLEWEKCPLGVLPWQQHQHHLDKEEYEDRQQQRTWSKLSLPKDWSRMNNDLEDFSDERNEHPSSMRRIKEGRVKKSNIDKNKPVNGKIVKLWNHSPHKRAIDFLAEIQQSLFSHTLEN